MKEYTKKFLYAIDPLLLHEGGYNNIKNDKGGATNWGVSLRFLKSKGYDIDGDGNVDYHDVIALTRDKAVDIYFNDFWRWYYDVMPARIASKVFNIAVNAGHRRAHIILQRSVNELGGTLKVDGLIGRYTLLAIKRLKEEDSLLDMICNNQQEFYEGLVTNDPGLGIFLKGWTNRAKWKPLPIDMKS